MGKLQGKVAIVTGATSGIGQGIVECLDAVMALEKKPAETKPELGDKSPQTGDSSNLMLWIALLFISGGVVTGTAIISKKKEYNR